MTTRPEVSTEPNVNFDSGFPAADNDFATYPIHKLVSVFEDPAKVGAAIDELRAHGFVMDDIEAFCGWNSENEQSFEGARPGVWDTIVNAGRHVGPARTYIERYERNLQDGHCIIMVAVSKEERKQLAAEILHHHTDERVTFFGLLAATEIP